MEEEASSRPSVAELAGKFKDPAHPPDAAGKETKPVRRRPPRSLQLTKTPGDDPEPPGVTSPLPAKAKRNSALIEKLQANLVLSPTALLPSPKSPGFRMLPPAFTPPAPSSAPVSTATTPLPPASPVGVSPCAEEEGPVSFDAPPTAVEGSILSNTNIKGRARHSLRRRPPSRRHRKTSSGEEVGNGGEEVGNGGEEVSNGVDEASLSSPTEPEDKTKGGGGDGGGDQGEGGDGGGDEGGDGGGDGGGDEGGENSKKEGETIEDKTDTLTKISVETRGGDEEKTEGGEDGDGPSSERKEEEEAAAQKGDLDEGATNTNSKEDEKKSEETTSQSSAG